MNEKVFFEWLSTPFPQGSENDVLDELHADLAFADSMVASTLMPFIRRGIFEKDPYLDRGELLRIIAESKNFQSDSTEERKAAEKYARYGQTLLAALDAYISARRSEPLS